MEPENAPITIDAHPGTKPAAGVIATKPAIMPLLLAGSVPAIVSCTKFSHAALNGRFFVVEDVERCPGEQAHSRASMGVYDSHTGIRRSWKIGHQIWLMPINGYVYLCTDLHHLFNFG